MRPCVPHRPQGPALTLSQYSLGSGMSHDYVENDRDLAPPLEVTLGPGDVLYMPAGYMHRAAALKDEDSLHYTLAVEIDHTFQALGLIEAALASTPGTVANTCVARGVAALRKGVDFWKLVQVALLAESQVAGSGDSFRTPMPSSLFADCDSPEWTQPFQALYDELVERFIRAASLESAFGRLVHLSGSHPYAEQMLRKGLNGEEILKKGVEPLNALLKDECWREGFRATIEALRGRKIDEICALMAPTWRGKKAEAWNDRKPYLAQAQDEAKAAVEELLRNKLRNGN